MERCAANPAEKQWVGNQWLHVLDGIIAIHNCAKPSLRSSYGKSLRIWVKMGDRLKANPETLRMIQATGKSVLMGAIRGCSWVRCPQYQIAFPVPSRELLRCSRCKSVSCVPLAGARKLIARTRFNIARCYVNDSESILGRNMHFVFILNRNRLLGTGWKEVIRRTAERLSLE